MTRTAPPSPTHEEIRGRQVALAASIREQGLDGVLVWSSCGSGLGAFGDAFYLTNHYSPVPRVNVDIVPFMTGWGQTAVIVTADGDVTLVSENGDIRHDLIVTGRLAHARDVYGETIRALRAAGLADGRVGLAGAACMPLAAWQRIEQELPGLQTTPADDLLAVLKMRKSPAEIELMRHASAIGCDMQNAMLPLAVPGARDLDLAVEGMRVCMEAGAVLWDFAFASGPASGHGYWNRLPPWDRDRRFEAGDIVHPDAYGAYDGYFFDLQRTVVVGGDPAPRLRWLLDGVVGVVEALCAACTPGVGAADVARVRDQWLADYGYADPPSAAEAYEADLMEPLTGVGHGLGLGFELPWVDTASPWTLEAGMTIALEVYLSEPGVGTVAFEHVVLVTESEPEILTLGCPSKWW